MPNQGLLRDRPPPASATLLNRGCVLYRSCAKGTKFACRGALLVSDDSSFMQAAHLQMCRGSILNRARVMYCSTGCYPAAKSLSWSAVAGPLGHCQAATGPSSNFYPSVSFCRHPFDATVMVRTWGSCSVISRWSHGGEPSWPIRPT
jgi:hypothetical protein